MSLISTLWKSYTRSWGVLRQTPIIAAPYIGLFLVQSILKQWTLVPELSMEKLSTAGIRFFALLWVVELSIKAITTHCVIYKIKEKPFSFDLFWSRYFKLFTTVILLALPLVSSFAATLYFPNALWAKILLILTAILVLPFGVLLEFSAGIIFGASEESRSILKRNLLFLRFHFLKGFTALSLGMSSLIILTVIGVSLETQLPYMGGVLGALVQGFGYAMVYGFYAILYLELTEST